MAKQDIKAGAAYVELGLKDSQFVKGLNRAQRRFQSWGKGISTFGAGITALGGAIIAPMVKAVQIFARTGDELDKMSRRTGISAQALAELGFAAEQSGNDMGNIEKAIRIMQKGLNDASDGTGPLNDALGDLGLSFEALERLAPDEQFELLGNRISDIEDPTKRAAAAMDVFGSRSGTALLPMLKDMTALRQEARDLGLVPSQKAVDDAAAVTDAINRVRRVVMSTFFEIGAALAPAVLPAFEVVTRILVGIQRWVRENGQLFITITKVGLAVMAAGIAITTLGVGIFAIGSILGGVATAISVFGSILGFLISPVGIITALLIGGVAAWLAWTDSGQDAISKLKGVLSPFLAIFTETFAGIKDALMAGDLSLAGEIALTGLRLAFLVGIDMLANSVGGAFGDFLGTIGTQIASGDFAGAWETAVLGMSAIWDAFTEGIKVAFADAATAVTDIWENTVNKITDTILAIAASDTIAGKALSKVLGVDIAADQAKQEQDRLANIRNLKADIASEEALLAKAVAGSVFDESLGENRNVADIEARLEEKRRQLAQESGRSVDLLGDTQASARDITGGTADHIREVLARSAETARKQTDESFDKLAKATEGGASETSEAVRKTTEELARLRQQAADARAAEDARRAAEREETASGFGGDGNSKIFGAFNSAAALAFSFGRRPEDEMKRVRDKLDELKDIDREMLMEMKALNAGGVFA